MKNLEIIQPKDKNSMRGAGVIHRHERLITHTTLHHSQSALFTFIPWQIAFITVAGFIIVLGLAVNFTAAIIVVVAILSGIYFIDVVFNLAVILKSLYFPPEIRFKASDLKKITNASLPTYSILCPLYREAQVLPDFLNSIKKLDWPKDKLEVFLLLEEDDGETISAASSLKLPGYMHMMIVPESQPKTKPKACNFGLSRASGKYLVVFDAEDRPEPDQLKKAYLGFKKASPTVVCLQAKLNYFNPHQNLLTRLFTAEYSLWFDVILTGLQSINTSIPLGGTSNHFKTKVLKNLKGWDPFNVTEDCDLGIRLFKKGYKTAIIDSTTWEEANSNVRNWLRQRSRWIKGYLQTYLVHNRHPINFIREHGMHALIFQLIIGARMSFMLINPILWLLTISYFTLYAIVGPTIESFYPAPVFYMAVTSLLIGNFMYAYNYMIGVAKRKQWNLIKFIYLIPFYWLMASVAAGIALYQLIVKPHYWEKTIHGLHLKEKDTNEITSEIIPEVAGLTFPKKIRSRISELIGQKQLFMGGSILIVANMIANFSNFIFNTFLGRKLTFEDFGEISLFTSILVIGSIPLNALSSTITHQAAYLFGKYSKEKAKGYLEHTTKYIFFFSGALTLLWLFLIPFLPKFFQIDSVLPFILFTPIWVIGLLSANYSGYLRGVLSFGVIGVMAITEAFAKLAAAWFLVNAGYQNFVVVAIPLSILISLVVGWIFIRKTRSEPVSIEESKFNKPFFTASNLNGISAIALLGADVILAKHFLSPYEAGQYSILSLIGKITYFTGSLLSPFMIPLVSNNDGAKRSNRRVFVFLFTSTLILSGISFVILGLFGNYSTTLLFGSKALNVLNYLPLFTLTIAIFTISKPIISYYLAKQNYIFSIAGFLSFILQVVLISFFHKDLNQFISMMFLVSAASLELVLILHLFRDYVKIALSNLTDLYGLFFSDSKIEPRTNPASLNILIFNWRDTKHKWAGGAEVYIHELAKRWVKDGNNVTIFCGNGTKRPRNEKIDGVQVYRRGGFFLVYIWAFLYYIFKFRGKYDVIIDCENGIPFFTPFYCRKPKFLLIHHVHQEVFRKSLIPPFAWVASFLETKLMPLIYRNIQVITVSPSSKQEILRHKLTKTEPIVIYNGIDLNKFKPGEKSKNPLILYLGRLQFYKSLNIFLEAAKQLLDKIPEVKFVIAGEGEHRKILEKYAQKLGILKEIQFLGRVSEEEKIRLFQKAWVFVNPSMMEGWSLTTLEAAACGTPAVASDVPGLRDSIRNPHTGFLVPYGKSDEFADKILELIEDKDLRGNLSKKALKWSNEFTWEKSATEFYSIVINKVGVKEEKVIEKAIMTVGN